MRKLIALSSSTSLAFSLIVLGVGVPNSAQAATPATLCPTTAAVTTNTSSGDLYDPAIWSNPVNDLVNCQLSFEPPMDTNNPARQSPAETIAVDFGPIPASAFSGNDLTIHLEGTYGNGGYFINFWVDKNVTSTLNNSSAYVARQLAFFVGSVTAGSATRDYTVTVNDPAKKAKIIAGDYAMQIHNVGGVGLISEKVTSISIPYTKADVTFDANGGTGTQSAQHSAVAAALAPNLLTRSAYNFAGWNTAADGSGTAYADAATFPFSTDTTLYAQWTADPAASATTTATADSTLATTGAPNRAPVALAGGFLVLAGLASALGAVARRRAKQK